MRPLALLVALAACGKSKPAPQAHDAAPAAPPMIDATTPRRGPPLVWRKALDHRAEQLVAFDDGRIVVLGNRGEVGSDQDDASDLAVTVLDVRGKVAATHMIRGRSRDGDEVRVAGEDLTIAGRSIAVQIVTSADRVDAGSVALEAGGWLYGIITIDPDTGPVTGFLTPDARTASIFGLPDGDLIVRKLDGNRFLVTRHAPSGAIRWPTRERPVDAFVARGDEVLAAVWTDPWIGVGVLDGKRDVRRLCELPELSVRALVVVGESLIALATSGSQVFATPCTSPASAPRPLFGDANADLIGSGVARGHVIAVYERYGDEPAFLAVIDPESAQPREVPLAGAADEAAVLPDGDVVVLVRCDEAPSCVERVAIGGLL